MGKVKDLTGQRFGKLVVLHRDTEWDKVRAGRQIRWICQCDCGNTKSIIGAELTRSNKPQRSCGCEAHNRAKEFGKITFKDLTGQKFGALTVIEKVDTNKYGYAIWKCRCECGNICLKASRELLSGDTLSCGCVKSQYERRVGLYLTNHNYQFIREYTFKDLKSNNDKPLRFDFAVFQDNKLYCLIECQGQQHYKEDNFYSNDTIQEYDERKRQYCLQNNIKLYELKYTENIEERMKEIFEGSEDLSDLTME